MPGSRKLDNWDRKVASFLDDLRGPPTPMPGAPSELPVQTAERTAATSAQTPAQAPKARKKKDNGELRSIDDVMEQAEIAVEDCYLTIDPERAARLSTVPEAFVEPVEKAYPEDEADRLLTVPGFVTDYVNCMRGMESPTIMGIWGALWTISSALHRGAWLEWYPKPVWPNIYVFIIAPPALCRKSSALDIGVTVLTAFHEQLAASPDRFLYRQNIVTSKATADGLLASLKPEEQTFITDPSTVAEGSMGDLRMVRRGSKATIAVSELPTFLGKQQYNQGLISLLTDLYDCRDKDGELTRGRGYESYESIYVTLIGAIAPDGLRRALPAEAFGDGFMSRVISVYQDIPTKLYSRPKRMPGYPTPPDLVDRLAWIAQWKRGGFDLTPEADVFYNEWYMGWKKDLFANGTRQAETFRIDILVLKVALLLAAQEYSMSTEIRLEHVKLALKLISFTTSRSKTVLKEVGSVNTSYGESYLRVRKQLEEKGELTRKQLLQGLSYSGIKAEEIDEIIAQLVEEAFVRITLNGVEMPKTSKVSRETYTCMVEAKNG